MQRSRESGGAEPQAVRVAVVGAGRIARVHLAALAQTPGVRTVAVCDLHRALARAAAERFGVPESFSDHRALLDATRPDVVHVTTPAHAHAAVAADALKAGAHVLVEKPLAPDLDGALELIELARGSGRVLLEEYNYLFDRSVRRLLEWRDAGAFGAPVHAALELCLPFGNRTPRAALEEFATHFAYLLRAFIGAQLEVQLSGPGVLCTGGGPEYAALLRGETGMGSVRMSGDARPARFRLRVWGTRMSAEADLFEPRLRVERERPEAGPLQAALNGLGAVRAELGGALASVARKLAGGPGSYEGHWELTRRAHRALRSGEAVPFSLDDIAQVNRLAHALTGAKG